MDALQTNQEQDRSEETQWTEREIELASKHQVEPKLIRLLVDLLDEQKLETQRKLARALQFLKPEIKESAAGEDNPEAEEPGRADRTGKQIAGPRVETSSPPDEQQPQKASTTMDRSNLADLLSRASYETCAAVFVGLELAKQNRNLIEHVQSVIKELMPEFFKGRRPEKTADGQSLDVECDVLPATEWLRFLDGFRAAGGRQEETVSCELTGEPMLRTIKQWISQRSYPEKLAFALGNELIMHESYFDLDSEIGNDFLRKCRQAVIEASGNPEYLEQSPKDELVVTSMTALMQRWEA